MPGEHEPHQRILMAWPQRPDNWRNNAGPAQAAFAAVIEAIRPATAVTVCVPEQLCASARALLHGDISLLEIPYDDCWMRDIGPSYLTNQQGELRGVDWCFNAWGGELDGLYQNWQRDDAFAGRWQIGRAHV